MKALNKIAFSLTRHRRLLACGEQRERPIPSEGGVRALVQHGPIGRIRQPGVASSATHPLEFRTSLGNPRKLAVTNHTRTNTCLGSLL